MTDRDSTVVERELFRLIRFLADPESVPADQLRFQFRHNEFGTISKAEARGWSQHPRASAPTAARGTISA